MKKFLKLLKKEKIKQIIKFFKRDIIIIFRCNNFSKVNNVFLKKLSVEYNFFFYRLNQNFSKIILNQGSLVIVYFNNFNFDIIERLNKLFFFDLILLKFDKIIFSKNKLNKYINNTAIVNKNKNNMINFFCNNNIFIFFFNKFYKLFLIKILFNIKIKFQMILADIT